MPRYFFHIKSDDDFVEDPEGVELTGDVEARQEAVAGNALLDLPRLHAEGRGDDLGSVYERRREG